MTNEDPCIEMWGKATKMILVATLIFFSICTLAFGATPKPQVGTYIPPGAVKYASVVKVENATYLPSWYQPAYFGALIEHESCVSLTHSKCWNPKSQLKTAREEGAGLGQITRAYKADGSVRFDALSDMRKQYRTALNELSWSNVYSRPDLQIRTIVLMTGANLRSFADVPSPHERMAMVDAAYNGGVGGVRKERRICGLTRNCDPQKWFKNVELTCGKSLKALYGNRSACDINRHHVTDVVKTRLPKYRVYYSKLQ